MIARVLLCVVLALSAAAQRPIFEPDDFVEPALHSGPIFLPRIVIGGAWNRMDHSRPIDGDTGFVLLTNSLYIKQWQFDYKHTENFNDDDQTLQRCDCPHPVYFPTPPPDDATPAGPQAKRRDTLQLAFYHTPNPSDPAPITVRFRLSLDRLNMKTVIRSISGEPLEKRSAHDQSLTLDADTHLPLLGWGTVYVARTWRFGTPHEDRAQNEFIYVWRPSGWSAGEVLFRGKLAAGFISDRGSTSLNVVNPSLEAFWRHRDTRVNFHLVLSPEATRDGEGWRVNHEVALFADYTLKIFGR